MSEYTEDQLRIVKALDPEGETYVILEDKIGKLYYDEAKELMETPFADVLFGLPESTKEIIFDTAMSEANAFDCEESKEPWFAVFNEYRDYMNIVKFVRLSQASPYEIKHRFDSAKTVAEASNKLGHAFSMFRSKPGMTDEEAQEIMEACFQLTAVRLNPEALNAIFVHGENRYSANGFAEVFEDYSASIQIAQMVIPEPEDYAAINSAFSTRLSRASIVASLETLTDEELFAVIETTENEDERMLAAVSLGDRGL